MTEQERPDWHPHYFFSAPQPTIEAAQAFHTYELFNCGAVFQTPEGYVYGQIREMDSPPRKTAEAVQATVGYTMVSYHGALLDVWQAFPPATSNPDYAPTPDHSF